MTFWQKFIQVLTPWHKRGGYAAPHVGILGFIVGFVLLVSALTAVQYGASYFEHKYLASVPVPQTSAGVRDIPVARTTGHIKIKRYPAVGDQDGQGACAAFVSTWALSYEVRVAHHNNILFSPRYAFDYYTNTYNGGVAGGSWVDQDVEYAANGIPTWKQLPEGPTPYGVDRPTPTFPGQFLHKVPHTFHVISGYAQGAGQGAIDGMKAAINSGHAVLVGFPVWSGYDNATQTNGLVVSPTASELAAKPQGRGGHENAILAYDDNKLMPDGSRGAALAQNQWTTRFGVSGRVWLSYDFLRRFSFDMKYLTLGGQTGAVNFPTNKNQNKPPITFAGPPPPFFRKDHALVPLPNDLRATETQPITPTASSNWVANVPAKDVPGLDLAPLINNSAHRYGLSAPGLLSVLGAECGLYTHSTQCDRYGYPPDVSFGSCQVTVQTAAGFGVGNGYNVEYIRNYENVASQCIDLAARVLQNYASYERSVGCNAASEPPFLDVAWNAGPAQSCYFLTHPSGQAGTNFYNDYSSWWGWALSKSVYQNPVRPFRKNPKFGSLSPYWDHHGVSWEYSIWTRHKKLGHALDYGTWHKGKPGYDLYAFERGEVYAWPKTRQYKVVRRDCFHHLDSCL